MQRSNYRIAFYLYRQDELQLVGLIEGFTPAACGKVGTDLFVCYEAEHWGLDILSKMLPSKIGDWLESILGSRFHCVTKVVSWDGRGMHLKQRWSGRLIPEGIGKRQGNNWVLIIKAEQGYDHFVSVFVTSLYRYRLLFGTNGRYCFIWQKDFWAILPPAVCSANLDGDGDDEIVFADSVNSKVEVLKIVPKKGDK